MFYVSKMMESILKYYHAMLKLMNIFGNIYRHTVYYHSDFNP